MSRRLLTALACAAVAFCLSARAEIDSKSGRSNPRDEGVKGDPKILVEDSAARQAALKRAFESFRQKLAVLAGRLENGSDKDKEKAKALRKALRKASELGTEAKFDSLIRALTVKGADKSLDSLGQAVRDNAELRKDLQQLIALLAKDDAQANREQIEKMARLLEQLKELIAKQERVRAQTEIGRKSNKELEKDQNKVTKETRDLIDGKNKDKGETKGEGKPTGQAKGEGKDDTKIKAENKPGEGKDGKEGKTGEPKDGKEGKAGEGKDGNGKEGKPGEGKDGKSGEGKDGKGKDGKPGEGKPGEGKEGKDSKAGEGKEGKPGEGKEGKPGEGKPGNGKEGKPGEGKPGDGKEGKPGEGKEGKAGQGKDGKPGEAKPGDGKASQGKGSEGKPGEGKPGEGKPGTGKEGKPGAGKPGEGKAGSKPGEGKPSSKAGDKPGQGGKGKGEGKGEAKPGKPGGGKPGQGKPSEAKPGQGGSGSPKPGSGKGGSGKPGNNPPQQQEPNDNPVKKQIEDANKYQKQAETDLDKNKKDDAADKQTKAIKELEAAKKKLEELLKQMREEEIERKLADLEKRCRYMLALQIEVRDGTVTLDGDIQKALADKLTYAARSNKLRDKEEEIAREADGALEIIKTEASAVAFAEGFVQVKDDVEKVVVRLGKTNTDKVTVQIENDIIETLKDMIEALKKAQRDLKNPPQAKPSKGGMPQDQRLIDQLAELKMIYAMQRRINARTELYGKQYKGEQAPPPVTAKNVKEREHYEMIQKELKDLSGRQDKLGKVTKDIATGKNEAK